MEIPEIAIFHWLLLKKMRPGREPASKEENLFR